MIRSLRCVAVVCGSVWILVFSAVTSAAARHYVVQAGSDESDDEPSAGTKEAEKQLAEAAQRADELFGKQKWSEARSAYDRVLLETAEWSLPGAHRLLQRSVRCSLKLGEPGAAARQVTAFRVKTKRPKSDEEDRRYISSQDLDTKQRREVATLEFFRGLLDEIGRAMPKTADEQTRRLATNRVQVDFELLKALDPDSVRRPDERSESSLYPKMAWWWHEANVAHEDEDESPSQESDVPVTPNGQPIFLQAPPQYQTSLGRPYKILYLIEEIGRLDPTSNHEQAAKAMLHRADLARRLYGPGTDPQWSFDLFLYALRGRPDFLSPHGCLRLKEFWQLEDDEAKSMVGGRVRVITLPASESPLAIWSRVEKLCPKSEVAGEATYRRGLYFQQRRQFAKALAEYRRLIADYHGGPIGRAYKQIEVIEGTDILLGKTSVYTEGRQAKFWFACRNADQAEFTLRRFDLKRYLAKHPPDRGWRGADTLGQTLFGPSDFAVDEDNEDMKGHVKEVEEFIGPVATAWTEKVERSELAKVHTTRAPVTPKGTYVIEARIPGQSTFSRGLVVITDAVIVEKHFADQVLFWVVNPRTGQPLGGRKVDVALLDGHDEPAKVETLTTDAQGVASWKLPKGDVRFYATLDTGVGRLIHFEQSAERSEAEPSGHAYGVTDRPLYRPGAAVRFRIWLRDLVNRQFRPGRAGVKHTIHLMAPNDRDTPVASLELVTDETGSVTGSFTLDRESELGQYRLAVDGFNTAWPPRVCQFRVEEYKKPEFEVSVNPPPTAFRLGEPIRAKVKARYYSGGPVSGASVHYKVVREDYHPHYAMPREWDWLYGNGFGDYEYSYNWLEGRDMQDQPPEDSDETDMDRPRGSQRVADGTVRLGADGSAEIRFDTTEAGGDCAYQYTIHVEVRDESRRTVEASGTVIAAAQEFNAFAELDRGWYEPGSQAAVDVNTRSTNDTPLAVDGTLTLYRIKTTAADSEIKKVDEELAAKWQVRTGADGHHQHRFSAPEAGHYRLAFEAHDSRQQPVRTSVNFWVYGPKLDARRQGVGDLEIIPDRRWYQVGETARLLVNTSHAQGRLLMFDGFQRHWFVDVTATSQLIEVPLQDKHVPNYFVEATLVGDGAIHTEQCELYVPPIHDVLKVAIEPDRPSHRPGDKGRVRIQATDLAGKPVSGSMALTAYDQSLTSISQEETDGPRSLLTFRRVSFSSGVVSPLGARLFSVWGRFGCPQFQLENSLKPQFQGGIGGGMPSEKDPSSVSGARRGRPQAAKRSEKEESRFEPVIRSDFSDSTVWLPKLSLDERGTASAEISYPDSLTTWRIRGYLITNDTRVGDGTSEVTTVKSLLVRLQAPRFAVQGDAITLSADVQNDLSSAKSVNAELIVPAAQFESTSSTPQLFPAHDDRNLHFVANASIGSHAQARFDWPVLARAEGTAAITVKIRSDGDGDAMRLQIPIREPGSLETQSQTGIISADELGEKILPFELPTNIDSRKTRIDVSLSPSPCGAVFDAIPFLAGYPYGCVEQTMSRFYPTVLATDAIRKLGLRLESLPTAPGKRQHKRRRLFEESPVFDTAELGRMAAAGLSRLYKFQHDDGGWGWWEHDNSTPYMTAYVLLGLATAADAGVKIREDSYSQAVDYLYQTLAESSAKQGVQERALVAYVLSLVRSKSAEEKKPDRALRDQHHLLIRSLLDSLDHDRKSMNEYGRALLALTLFNRGERELAQAVLREVLTKVHVDKTKTMAAVTREPVDQWHWYTSDVETNAWVLRAIVAIDPHNSLPSLVANWLAAHRRHGEYWDSTRDTALAVHALSDYLIVAYKDVPDFNVSVALDGRHVADISLAWKRLLAGECRIELDGSQLKPGIHRVTLARKKRGPIYYAMSLCYFDQSERKVEKGTGIHVSRRYYKRPLPATIAAQSPEPGHQSAARQRSLLKDGDTVGIGETVEVELSIKSDGFYEFIAFEDPKPAGFEPIRLQSGYGGGGEFCSNVELRDENVAFFADTLWPGKHLLSYELRAEVPGTLHARPTRAFDMYNPQISAHGADMRLRVQD